MSNVGSQIGITQHCFGGRSWLPGCPVDFLLLRFQAHLCAHQKMITDKLQASDMMASEIVALPLRPKVAEVIHVIKNYNHSTYAVTTEPELSQRGEPFKLFGVIRKSQMVRMLKHRLGVIRKVCAPIVQRRCLLLLLHSLRRVWA